MRLFPLQIITKTWLILAAESNRFFWSVSKEFYFFPFNILFIFIVITQFLGKIASQILVLFGVLNTLFATVARFCWVILLLLSWFCHTFSQVLALKMYRDKKGKFVCWHYSLRWLATVASTYTLMDQLYHLLSFEATIKVSIECAIIGEQVGEHVKIQLCTKFKNILHSHLKLSLTTW